MVESATRVAKFALALLKLVITLPFQVLGVLMMAGAAVVTGWVGYYLVHLFFVPFGVPEVAADIWGVAIGLLVFGNYIRSAFFSEGGVR